MTDAWGDDVSDTIFCPYCRHAIHEDSVRCPQCENYLSEEDRPSLRKPWWLIVVVGVCLLIVATWICNG